MEEKVLYKIEVRGRVQGVGFRYFTVKEARSLGITGFVKNMPDGSVYIEAEGAVNKLNEFVQWCHNGPGIVTSVQVSIYPAVGYNDFHIEY